MKILGLIPARGGSKGVPRKNIKLLHKKPLIEYSIESALKCNLIDKVVVSTDDKEIAAISVAAGADVPFMRPEELSTDQAPSIGLVIHALNYFREKGENFDAVCLLQPTVPYRSSEDLKSAIEKFQNGNFDSLVTVREVPHIYNPYWTFQEDDKTGTIRKVISDPQLIVRRQELPTIYHRDGSVYVSSSDAILNKHSLYGSATGFYVMTSSPNVNIDTMEDWEIAEKVKFNNN